MDWFNAKKDDEPKPKEPFNPPFVKTEAHCVIDGCHELKQVGQGAFCAQHVRAS